ncbi:MAG: transglutaminase family protein [Eubacteriales bacterium]
MKKLLFESTTTLRFDAPVTGHHFLLRSIPPSYPGQRILSAKLKLTPDASYHVFYDGLGNYTQTGCIQAPHTEFIYHVSGVAEINETALIGEPLLPIYKYPSSYTHVSAEMKVFAEEFLAGGGSSVLDMALRLAGTIFSYMTYQPNVTTTQTTAAEAFAMKCGVCQDYSHIFIAIARHIGIPARYANGLPLGAGPSHAWVEVYVDDARTNCGKWIGIDPTHNRLVGEDYVRFCQGRDFLDCSLERGVLFGLSNQIQETYTEVVEQ